MVRDAGGVSVSHCTALLLLLLLVLLKHWWNRSSWLELLLVKPLWALSTGEVSLEGHGEAREADDDDIDGL